MSVTKPSDMNNSNTPGVYGTGKSWVSDMGVLVPGSPRNIEPVKRSLDALEQFSRIAVPPGVVQAFAGSSTPSGWLLCHGQSLSRTTYAALYAAIGTAFGSASSTTFNIPDLRGRVPAGIDGMGGTRANRLALSSGANTRGGSGGLETRDITTNNLPSHSHSINHTHKLNVASPSNTGTLSTDQVQYGRPTGTNYTNSNAITNNTVTNSGSTGAGSAFYVTQPWIALNYIIKF